MHTVNKHDYRTNVEVAPGYYRVPLSKQHRTIKPDYNNMSDKLDKIHCETIKDMQDGDGYYNGNIRIATRKNKTYVYQYRDGCFYPYIGLLAT